MILEVKNLSKKFKQGETIINAVNDLSFSLENGKSLSITGPSGSGKTTVMSLLAGLDSPSKGEIDVDGVKINNLSEKELSQFRAKNIGIVFQQFHLMPHLSALENVCLPLEINKIDDVTIQAKKILESVGLSDRINHLPSQLSGGEKQRVAIARAIVLRPKLILADEPSGNLDTDTGKKVMDLLFKMTDEFNLSLVLITHDLQLAKRCDQQINLFAGLRVSKPNTALGTEA